MAHFEKKRSSREIFQGRVVGLTVDTVELEDGSQARREVVHHHGGAGILPLTEDNQVYMVRQFRYAFGRELLEIPAGKLEPGEDPRAAALRELQEECGLTADTVEDLGSIYPSVGYDTEEIHIYLARGLHQVPAQPDQGEFLTLEKWPLEALVQKALTGELRDAKSVAAVLKTKMRT